MEYFEATAHDDNGGNEVQKAILHLTSTLVGEIQFDRTAIQTIPISIPRFQCEPLIHPPIRVVGNGNHFW